MPGALRRKNSRGRANPTAADTIARVIIIPSNQKKHGAYTEKHSKAEKEKSRANRIVFVSRIFLRKENTSEKITPAASGINTIAKFFVI